ncbi:septum site-determining protein MinD [Aeromicrobium ponti]|uniref:Pilus assembly protein CpaE n=1 Tax=Cytobacillus oceanisediminis TaxID=665099 RepID=A0A562JRL4_9BACI|nr:P-loop NTPase [Cytobacillus oceanisediminis]TWH85822.1 pilus assembly protein CpaE [Cytobacillus oceanisediminis]
MAGTFKDNYKRGKMIVICSASGGTGRTAVTVNLAAMLAKRKMKVDILDADWQFGDIAMALNLEPAVTIKEIAEKQDSKNARNYTSIHSTGIGVLAAPDRPEYADMITSDVLEATVSALLSEAQVLLAETEGGLTDRNLQLMEMADIILLITTPGIGSLKNTKLMIETLEALELKDKVKLVVNQKDRSYAIKASMIPKLVGVEPFFFLPSEKTQLANSLDLGEPIVLSHPKLRFSKGIEGLAERLYPQEKQSADSGFLKLFQKKITGVRGRVDELIGKNSIEESKGIQKNQ